MNVFTILLLGSVLGVLEATLGGFLHLVRFPLAGQIMGSIAIFLMMYSLRLGLKPFHLIVLSSIAALFKFIDPLIFGVPFFDITIINPAQAIIMEGLSFALAVRIFKMSENSIFKDIFASIFTVSLWALLFNAVSYFVLAQPIMPSITLNIAFGAILAFSALRICRYTFNVKFLSFLFVQPSYVKAVLAVALFGCAVITRLTIG
jgi:hypothetical protein